MSQGPYCFHCNKNHWSTQPCKEMLELQREERARKARRPDARTASAPAPAQSATSCKGCLEKDTQITQLWEQIRLMNLELDAHIEKDEQKGPEKVDRKAYMRELMRQKRAAAKEKPNG